MTNADIYINFVMYAIYGRLGEADTLMRTMPESIREIADFLTRTYPVEPKPIYRGMLLDPKEGVRRVGDVEFMSWSEDRDVARWFASPDSGISTYVIDQRPNVRGFVASMPSPSSRVLFHYSWARLFRDFQPFAHKHPWIAHEGARQILWSLSTQQEVITEPIDIMRVTPIAEIDGASLDELDRKFLPPWEQEPKGIAL